MFSHEICFPMKSVFPWNLFIGNAGAILLALLRCSKHNTAYITYALVIIKASCIFHYFKHTSVLLLVKNLWSIIFCYISSTFLYDKTTSKWNRKRWMCKTVEFDSIWRYMKCHSILLLSFLINTLKINALFY